MGAKGGGRKREDDLSGKRKRYLWAHNKTGVWHYRRKVPSQPDYLRAMMGCTVSALWIRSLGTTDLSRIDTAWAKAHLSYTRAEEVARAMMGSDASPNDPEREHQIRFIAQLRSEAGGTLPARHVEDPVECNMLFRSYAKWRIALGLSDPYEGLETYHHPTTGVALETQHPDASSLLTAYELMRVETKLRLDTVPDLPAPITVKHTSGSRADSLTDLEVRYLADHPRLATSNRNTLKQMIKLFVSVNGNIPVQTINGSHAVTFREALQAGRQAANSKNRMARVLSSLLNWGRKQRYIDTNPLAGISFDTSEVKERDPFSPNDMSQLFAQPALMRPRRYWVTVLAFLHGLRQREAAQLYRSDVFEIGETWLIRVDDTEAGQRLKNKSSRRFVPIHPEAVHLGFIQFVKSIKKGPLFLSNIATSKAAVSNLSAELNDLIRQAGITNPKVVFHSTRHTMISQARENSMDTEIRKTITGHAAEDIGSQYGTTSLTAKARELAKLQYPVKFPKLIV